LQTEIASKDLEAPPSNLPIANEPGIRERLLLWQAAHPETERIVAEDDFGTPGHIRNALTRPEGGDTFDDAEDIFEGPSLPLFEKDDLVDFGTERSFLLRGDLVELR
jgi:hypothetical protein